MSQERARNRCYISVLILSELISIPWNLRFSDGFRCETNCRLEVTFGHDSLPTYPQTFTKHFGCMDAFKMFLNFSPMLQTRELEMKSYEIENQTKRML